MKNIILLGSTGSVGKSVLDIVRRYPDRFRLKAIAARSNVEALAEQASEFHPEIVAVGDEGRYTELKKSLSEGTRILSGQEGLEALASGDKEDTVFMAISGTAALKPLVAALKSGRTVALASKEPVVSAGKIITELARKNSATILPVDSEHSAIMQCLAGRSVRDLRMLYITGSGGSLRGRPKEDFNTLTVEEVLAHPKWEMGKKITVDSATLMNKGLEVIEAKWLFGIPEEKIKVVIHPEAIIHSMVEFLDGTITASLFQPDMRFPVLRALSYPDVIESDLPRVDFTDLSGLSFSEPDTDTFPALDMAFEALKAGGTIPAVLNSANEAAVGLFLEGRIRFTDIVRIVDETIKKHVKLEDPSLEDIIDTEKWAREEVLKTVKKV